MGVGCKSVFVTKGLAGPTNRHASWGRKVRKVEAVKLRLILQLLRDTSELYLNISLSHIHNLRGFKPP